jgi:hypothetical protein
LQLYRINPAGIESTSRSGIDMTKAQFLSGLCSDYLKSLSYYIPALLIICTSWFENITAQSISIQGIVVDQADSQPLIGANLVLEDSDYDDIIYGTATGRNGYYGISIPHEGRYILRVSHIGYITHTDTLDLAAGSRQTINIELLQDDEELDELHIAPASGTIMRAGGEQRIRTIDIARIPTPAGSGDLASYLQALPGVVSTGDRGGQLYIRGGTASQNMTLIDGSMIYQPFHIVNFYSAFPENLISGVDFYAGGFGSRYSNRISSVIDVQSRDGDRYRHRASGSLSPFLGELYLEGPIVSGTSSWILSGRRSMIEETSPWFMNEEQPLSFNSQFFKFSHISPENSVCSVTIMRTADQGRMDFESNDVFRWNNFVLGGRCMMLPQQAASLFELNLGVSHMSNAAGDRQNPELYSAITRLNMDLNLTRYLNNIRLEYGGFAHLKWYNYDLQELFQVPREETELVLGSGVYLEATFPIGERMRLRSGGVFTYYMDQYDPSFEPRFRFTWNPFGRDSEEFSASAGIYRQALVGLSDIRDVSSVFVAWMMSPEGGAKMEARHMMAGWRQSLGGGFQLALEGYYKQLRNLPITTWSTLARFNTDLSMADGYIYGSDVRLEYNRGIFYGFAGYGYNWTKYETTQDHFTIWFDEPVQKFHPPHDRRHQFNSMASVTLGQYRTSIRWQLGTGLPFTQPMGFDEYIRFDDGLPNIRRFYGSPRMIMEKPYQGRLPTYHRLDVSFERSFQFSFAEISLQAGAINFYDQSNMFYYDIYTQRQIDQLSFAPYFSVKMETR